MPAALATSPNSGAPMGRIATDPPVSERQRRAMYAAAEGRSTLGIPRSVGREFVGKDTSRREFGTVLRILAKFFGEEEREPEHAEDDLPPIKGRAASVMHVAPSGKILLVKRSPSDENYANHWSLPGGKVDDGETDEQAARRENAEEVGGSLDELREFDAAVTPRGWLHTTYAARAADEFAPTLSHEHTEHIWAAPDALPSPLLPGVAATIGRLGALKGMDTSEAAISARIKREVDRGHDPKQAAAIAYAELGEDAELAKWLGGPPKHAADARVALDRASVREYTPDGHLKVEATNISKANVCEYLGAEIPDAEALGLDPKRKYRLWRHPEELAKAADTFNGLPLLSKHVPVSSTDHPKGIVVGSTGTEASFEAPYLRNALNLWDQGAIDDVEDDVKKEISCGYRYVADMSPGVTPEGEAYDGVMRNIVGNHVALVREGRAGPDVVVQDEALPASTQEAMMAHLTLNQGVARGAIMAYLRPKLAKDAKVDVTPIVAKITSKKAFSAAKPQIAMDVAAVVKGKLAKDASIEDFANLLDVAEGEMGEDEESEEEKKRKEAEAHDAEPDEFLKKKLNAEDWKTYDSMRGARDARRAHDAEEEEKKKKEAEDRRARDESEKEREKEKAEDKKAMDTAIAEAVTAERAHQRAISEARDKVRPWIGEVKIACDSAEAVYRHALAALNVKAGEKAHPDALVAILEAQPLPSRGRPVIAADAAPSKGFFERYPGAAAIRVN